MRVIGTAGHVDHGKSTLIKCISGVHRLDEGEILLEGAAALIGSPAEARLAGIETVYQDLALFDNLTPAQNFFAGRELAGPSWLPRGLQFLKQRKMDGEAGCRGQSVRAKTPGVTPTCRVNATLKALAEA